MNISPDQMSKIAERATKTWLEPVKVRLRMLAGVKFCVTKDDHLLAAIAVSNKSNDERLKKARDAFVIMARMIHSDDYAKFAEEFEKEKRVLFIERETAGNFWNSIVTKTGPKAKSVLKEILGIGPAHNR
jgi:hypothetical protein